MLHNSKNVTNYYIKKMTQYLQFIRVMAKCYILHRIWIKSTFFDLLPFNEFLTMEITRGGNIYYEPKLCNYVTFLYNPLLFR